MARAVDPEGDPPSFAGRPGRGPLRGDTLALMIDAVQDYAIFMLSPDGTIMTWNTGAKRIKGYADDEIVGQNFSIFYPEEEVRAGKPQWELAVATSEGRLEDEGWRVRKDGSRFWANVVITALRDESGVLRGFGKVTRDLSDRRREEEARARFIANAAHELRTPLSVLLGMVSFLRTLPGPPDRETFSEYLETLHRQSTRMHALVNNLLDLTALEQRPGRVMIDRVRVDEVIGRALAAEPPPDGKRVGVDIGEHQVFADPHRLEQVFTNLLTNAYKYGGDRIEITAGDERDSISIRLSDDGPGMDPAIRDEAFEPFRRGQGHGGVVGSGLGLAIVKGFVESFGGTVTLESQMSGTTFVINLLKG